MMASETSPYNPEGNLAFANGAFEDWLHATSNVELTGAKPQAERPC